MHIMNVCAGSKPEQRREPAPEVQLETSGDEWGESFARFHLWFSAQSANSKKRTPFG